MGLLDRLLGRKEAQSAAGVVVEEKPECPHAALVPKWDAADDIGKSDLISSYTCESCGASFSRLEADRIQSAAAERLRVADEDRVTAETSE